MSDPIQVVLTQWNADWTVILLAAISSVLYFRGWLGLHRRQPNKYTHAKLAFFVSGVVVILFAIISPLDAYAGTLLQVHMAQHILLMMVAPPLLWLGWPALPLLCGLPPTIQKFWLGPFLASKGTHKVARFFVHPIVALTLFSITTWGWHYPSAYKLALESDSWHAIEHACFLFTALLFWFPVVAPEPSAPIWPRWAMIPYLLVADIQNTLFSAFFSFANEPIYDFYPDLGLFGTTLMRDQSASGALMWVASSAIFLIPIAYIFKNILTNKAMLETPPPLTIASKPETKYRTSAFFSSIRMRTIARSCMLVLALLVVLDGLLGPSLAPLNLAGILPWIWWRGLVIIAILVIGNVFCFACPFMLVRSLAKKLPFARNRFPAYLRNKWLAVIFFVAWLVVYETFSPWASPSFTAWIILGYFVFAFVIDAFFRGATFCKWVCPIGQFHFVLSVLSPFEIKAIKKTTCDECSTQDCLKGNATSQGCSLELFVPTKKGNLDCTFCMDCVRACPHDNAVLTPTFPGIDLAQTTFRGSIGSLQRADYTALMLVVVFGAFANASGMIAPVHNAIDSVSSWLGAPSPKLVTALFLVSSTFIIPSLLCSLTKRISRTENQVAWSLVPLGVAMWAAHLLFHFCTTYQTIIPVAIRALHDIGITNAPESIWQIASTPSWLISGELFLLTLGFLGSFAVCLQLAKTLRERVPWCIVCAVLFLCGCWILLQPMQMRGMIG
jgi:cytochrome c oxidase assembly factor CtaG